MSLIRHLKVLLRFACLNMIAAGALGAATVEASDAGKSWKERKVETVPAARYPDRVNQYGGDARYQTKATGFFYVTKQSGKWWLIDPDGHLFFSVGLNSVRSDRVGRESEPGWIQETYKLLKGNGFNTLGRWSDPDPFEQAEASIPWCSSLSFMKDYMKQRAGERSKISVDSVTMPVFDAAWPEFCEKYAMRRAKPLAEDPWLLGHFSDNELPFRPDALKHYLELPETDEGHIAADKWMQANNVTEDQIADRKVQAAFLELVARRYFETVARALKKADPNHLYIGSRLHGRSISESVLRAANACDVVTINDYHDWTPDVKKAADWERWSDRPYIVSEFYAMKVQSREVWADGAGFRVLNHSDAGQFYHTFTKVALEEVPGCVGWHWFKYADDNAIWQKGILCDQGQVHQELLDAMKVVNEQVYSLRGIY